MNLKRFPLGVRRKLYRTFFLFIFHRLGDILGINSTIEGVMHKRKIGFVPTTVGAMHMYLRLGRNSLAVAAVMMVLLTITAANNRTMHCTSVLHGLFCCSQTTLWSSYYQGPCCFFWAYGLPFKPEPFCSKFLFSFLQFTLILDGFCPFLVIRIVVFSYSLFNIYYRLNDANCSHLILILTLFDEEKQT